MKNLYDPISQPYIFFRNITKTAKSLPHTCYHRHNAFEIYLFLSGSRKVCVENAAYLCQPGDLFIIRPETFHAGLCDEDCEYDRIIMNIQPVLIDEICNKGAQSNDYASTLLCDTYMLQYLIFVNRWFERDDDISKEDNVMPQLVSDIMDHINRNITETITMEKLADNFHFHGRYISKLFKEYTGLTIRTYILDKRIGLAKKLLDEGCNVSEACYHSGFNDYANFLRSFKKYAGISPGRYKREHGNRIDMPT